MSKWFVCFMLGLCACNPSWALERLNDSASMRAMVSPQSVLTERGLAPEQDFSDYMRLNVSYGRVEYRLNTAAYVGSEARIYFVMPTTAKGMQSPQALRALWQGDGRFANGSAYMGEQALVWQGLVNERMMEVALDLRYEIDLNGFALPNGQTEGLQPYFLIERIR